MFSVTHFKETQNLYLLIQLLHSKDIAIEIFQFYNDCMLLQLIFDIHFTFYFCDIPYTATCPTSGSLVSQLRRVLQRFQLTHPYQVAP